jgi:hypothetical protein
MITSKRKGSILFSCIFSEVSAESFKSRRERVVWLACVSLSLIAVPLIAAQETTRNHLPQTFTGYPPSVYMGVFQACSSEKPCSRTENFRVDSVPKGCCILLVTNGNGLGKDEVRTFEVFLNGKSAVPADHCQNAQAKVEVRSSNTIKVILTEPMSKVFVLIAYDPHQAK